MCRLGLRCHIRHIDTLLRRSCAGTAPRERDGPADGSTRPLSFVVVIPHCDPSGLKPLKQIHGEGAATQRRAVPNASLLGWRMLRGSAFITTHIRVAKESHGYCEGSQHVRKTR